MTADGVGARREARANTTAVFHRAPRTALPVIAGGGGPYLFDETGRRYIDGSGGAAVSSLGHNHPRIVEAVKRQLDTIAFAHTGFFTSPPAEDLARFLALAAPGELGKVYFLSSGSEAIEAAIKLARQYFVEIGEGRRTKVISRRQSYHGNTLGALAAGGNIWRREKFGPLLSDVIHIGPCYAYRGQAASESASDYGRRVADELEAAILAAGPATVMCFIAETVGGATLGAVPPAAGYFRRVREICDRHGVLLILDEVMCGMGRTGSLFAFEQEGIVPDIVALGKGLAAGYQPLSAMMCASWIHDTIVQGSGSFTHGHTYTGHAAACAAALAVQETIRDENLLNAVRQRGAQLMAALRGRFADHPNVGDIRGRGLLVALEFVADRETKRPLDPALRFAARLKAAAMEEGLICYPMAGLIDGERGDHAMLAPPFIIEEAHVAEIVTRLGAAVDRTLADGRSG